MTSDQIGYCRPPKATRFQPGKSGNPAGRRKKTPDQLEKLAQAVLDAPIQYRENGRIKKASRREVAIKLVREKAVKGSVEAAELLLAMRSHAMRHGQKDVARLIVTDWLPDYAGQTGDQKAQDMQVMEPAAGDENHTTDSTDESPVAVREPLQGDES